MERYAVYFKHAKKWDCNKSLWDQGIRAHKQYWGKFLHEGRVLAGGPIMDHTDDFVILDAESIEEVQSLIKQDPAIIEKKFDATIYPWSAVIN